jgi:hypothetical protein
LPNSLNNISDTLSSLNIAGCFKWLSARLNERLPTSGKHPLKVFYVENGEGVVSVWH